MDKGVCIVGNCEYNKFESLLLAPFDKLIVWTLPTY